MIADPIRAMQAAVKDQLAVMDRDAKIEFDAEISAAVPWRPHVYEKISSVGWQLHPVAPDTTSWEKRIKKARDANDKLQIGIAAPEEVLSAEFLIACHRLSARIMIMKEKKDGFSGGQPYASVPDLICERQIKLEPETARQLLDLCLERALAAKTNDEKGVTLEILIALLLSQVDNFEVADVGISNRSQQMDVLIHNRAVGGVLGISPLVLAEAKNWKTKKVTPNEYTAFLRKLETRHRRAKLGILVTTGAFTGGVALEVRRDSRGDILVVLIDGKTLPTIWCGPESITKRFERVVIDATVGQ